MLTHRFLKISFFIILVLNVVYFTRIFVVEERKLRKAALEHLDSANYDTDDQIAIPKGKTYEELDEDQKVAYLLKQVENDKERYWLASTDMMAPGVTIHPKEFVRTEESNWATDPKLFYDPRFTLSVYLDEIKSQLKSKNPRNKKALDHLITVPFSWSDWVDLTMLNEELGKPEDMRADCGWLQSKINKPTKYPHFCVNLKDLSPEELEETGMPSKEYLPGFVVKSSPMNKAPHRQVMMQGKAHLLAYQENPLSIIFLTKNGTYEAQVDSKKRITHTDMFENYLRRRNIDANHLEDINNELEMNPVKEYTDLLQAVGPRPLDLDDDIHRMNAISRQKEANASRELVLDKEFFNYQQAQVDKQIAEYEERLGLVKESMTNELKYNPNVIKENSLDRHEWNHYSGLKYSNRFGVKNEPTYYKLATMIKSETKDPGWHYEWRFFNGALRYLKKGWTVHQLEIREQIILDRLLRNWFRFAEEKGIVSWIAHGPLLSWYWDGLMFPFDIDIDIQMPSGELNRLSKNYNMTLVVEDVSEGYGKYLIDCATFMHHRDVAHKDNHIDARFIDVDSGTYIDITGIGKNKQNPPPEYNSYIKSQNAKDESIELYMDRRKHWYNFEKIAPLRYSMIGGVPVYIPNDIMSMLNHEYSEGTRAFYFGGYYYVPQLRLWIQEHYLTKLFKEEDYMDDGQVNTEKMVQLIRQMDKAGKIRLLESDDEILMEYQLTHKYTAMHENEKKFLLDHTLQYSILDVQRNTDYHRLTSMFKMGKPLRKSLFDFEYIERHLHKEEDEEIASNYPGEEQQAKADEQKVAQEKADEERAAEQKASEERAAEQKAAEEKAQKQSQDDQKSEEQKSDNKKPNEEQKSDESKSDNEKPNEEQSQNEQKWDGGKSEEQKTEKQPEAEQNMGDQKPQEQVPIKEGDDTRNN